jgi:hypothetical protein
MTPHLTLALSPPGSTRVLRLDRRVHADLAKRIFFSVDDFSLAGIFAARSIYALRKSFFDRGHAVTAPNMHGDFTTPYSSQRKVFEQ